MGLGQSVMNYRRYGWLSAIATLLVLSSAFSTSWQPFQASLSSDMAIAADMAVEATAAPRPRFPSLDELAQVSETTQLGVIFDQGKLEYQQGHFKTAVAHWQQAAMLPQLEPLERAQALSHLSLAQQQLGDWSGAERSIAQSLGLARQEDPALSQQQLVLGQALNTQGSLLFAQGQTLEALEAWQQAEVAYGNAQDETRQLGSRLNQSQALQSLGFYARARDQLQLVQQKLERQPVGLRIIGLRNLGNLFWRMGELDASAQVLQQAIALAKAHNNSQQLSATLISLGNVEQAKAQTQQALEHYRQAAKISQGEVQFQATLNQFRLLLGFADWSKAARFVAPLQLQLSDLPLGRSSIYSATNFANGLIELAIHLPERTSTTEFSQLAAQTLVQMVQEARSLEDERAESYALGYLGHLYERSEQWSSAEELTQQALALAERSQATDIRYQWQWQLGRVFKAQGNLIAAKNAYRSSYRALQSLRSDLVAVQPDLQFSFRQQVEPVYREFVELLTAENSTQSTRPADLKLARQVIESLQVAELNDFFRTACLQDQIVDLDSIDRSATAVFYPIILPKRLTVIVSLPGQPIQSYSQPIAQSEVEQVVSDLRQTLEKPFTAPEGKRLGYQAYSWLIEPIEDDLKNSHVQTLAFVLDGALRNVPMAALHNGNQYLIEQYSIALTPGLQLLAPKPLKIKHRRALLAGLTQARHGFSELVHVAEEIKAIQSALPNHLLLNETFTSDALTQAVRNADFSAVHLATHGQFSSKAEETFVLAWDQPVKVAELSGALRQRNRPDPIELLVLSACETADGDERAGLGLAGVAVQAGARSTLASLWSVDDQSGSQFAKQFYQELLNDNMNRAESLRSAQLALLKDPNFRHPIYWAPYVLVGNWL